MTEAIEIIHSAITTEKITRNIWVAKCETSKPFKASVTMQGKTEQEAIDKLKKFFEES